METRRILRSAKMKLEIHIALPVLAALSVLSDKTLAPQSFFAIDFVAPTLYSSSHVGIITTPLRFNYK
jgi:hypothetical protein